jgi:hypothetical protein
MSRIPMRLPGREVEQFQDKVYLSNSTDKQGELVIYAGASGEVALSVYDGSTCEFEVDVANARVSLLVDSMKCMFGAGRDASVYYDGTDMHINPKEVGSGVLEIDGAVKLDTSLTFTGAGTIATSSNQNLVLLPNGTGITVVGDAGTPVFTLNANDDLFVSGKLEVKGVQYVVNTVQFWSSPTIFDDIVLAFGTSNDAKLLYETADANANEVIFALPDGGSANVPVIVIGDQGILNKDLGWFNGETIPQIAMVAADEGGYFSFGVSNADILTIKATTGPVVEVDETKFSHKLQVTINAATYYIMLTQT